MIHSAANATEPEPVVAQRSKIASEPHRDGRAAMYDIAVVIPCFNEAQGIERLQTRLRQMLELAEPQLAWQIIVVDDGSNDDTVNVLNEHFGQWPDFTLIRHTHNQGLVAALQTGFLSADSTWVACLDSDCTYSPEIVNDLWHASQENDWDVVVASPYHWLGRVENVPAWRIVLSRIASRLYRSQMRSKLTCYTGCVRLYRTALLRDLSLRHTGFAGVSELLWMLDRRGARMGEVPAVLRPRISGVSKLRTWSTTIKHLQLLATIAMQRFRDK